MQLCRYHSFSSPVYTQFSDGANENMNSILARPPVLAILLETIHTEWEDFDKLLT